jgi:hypothetical protein
MAVREIRWEVDSSVSGYVPVASCCEHGSEPSEPVRGGEFLNRMAVSFSRRTLFHGISVFYV